ncbi:MAG: efflux transporter outer membrane subunit [Campylobacterales bacterium]
MYKIFLSIPIALLLVGCSLKPDLNAPAYDNLPSSYDGEKSSSEPINKEWWKGFKDPVLDEMIDEAFRYNSNLLLAAANVAEARATLDLDRANQYPSLDAEAKGSRSKRSEQTFPQSPGKTTFNNFGLSAILSYELDLWGKLSSQKEASEAILEASRANRDAIKLALASDVASSYFTLIALKEQKSVAQKTYSSQKESYEYYKKQYDNGLVDELTLMQSLAELDSTEAALESIKLQEELQNRALKILIGKSPQEIITSTQLTDIDALSDVPKIADVPVGMPSSLLERRPDIRASLEQLRAANASVGVARANYFPSISLSGVFGGESEALKNLFRSDAQIWNLAGSAAMPLVDFGRVSAGVESAKAQKEYALISYQKSVKNAFKEVMDALNTQSSSKKRSMISKRQVETLQKSLNLSKKRFDAGYTSYLEVLDSQRGLFSAELQSVSNNLDVINSTITLYKALGGGWNVESK